MSWAFLPARDSGVSGEWQQVPWRMGVRLAFPGPTVLSALTKPGTCIVPSPEQFMAVWARGRAAAFLHLTVAQHGHILSSCHDPDASVTGKCTTERATT